MNSESRNKESKNTSGPLILGLDVGIASVGAAVINLGDERIEGLYVRAFDKAEVAKTGESLNAVRREARGIRRTLRRRRLRLKEVMDSLIQHSNGVLSTPMTPSELPKEVWDFRAKGLDRELTSLEFAAAIYHLQKYRGFQTNRRNEAASDEAGAMKSGIAETDRRLTESGARTVGELSSLHADYRLQKRNRRGNYSRAIDRKHTVIELTTLFAKQRELAPDNYLFSEKSEQEQSLLLNRRRPTGDASSILALVGRCTLEPQELRAPKACYSTERFVWLQKMNSIRISNAGNSRELTEDEQACLREFPFDKTKITFTQLRKALALRDSDRVNLCRYRDAVADSEKATLFEAKSFHAIRKALSDQVDAFGQLRATGKLDSIGLALTTCQTEVELHQHLVKEGLPEQTIDAIKSLSFSGFASLSLKAIQNLLPYLEQGQRYDEAVASAHYDFSRVPGQSRSNRLPFIDPEEIRNPVVARGMRQAIKVINAILKKHGPMHSVHVELARDVGKPRSERNKIEKDQELYKKNREAAREQFIGDFGKLPKGPELQKYLLYKEQDGKCLYSGKPLEINRLFEVGYSQIDHIQPFSRTFDNSQVNKVLVLGVENQRKGNQTPFEYFGNDNQSKRWLEFQALVSSNLKLRMAKKNRLLAERMVSKDDFLERNLNDTRYFARMLKSHIETHLELVPFSDASSAAGVVSVTGRATGFLRHRWDLTKDRASGDKHHAMDAAVVAATTRAMIQRISRYSKRKELEHIQTELVDYETGEILDRESLMKIEAEFPTPYPHFRSELLARLSDEPVRMLKALPEHCRPNEESLSRVKPLIVSRQLQQRSTGVAHKATIRRMIEHPDPWKDAGWTSKKVPLTEINLKKLESAAGFGDPREDALHALITQRLSEFGDDPKKAFAEDRPLFRPTKNGQKGPRVLGLRILEPHPSGLILDKKGGMADNGAMVRIDIYRLNARYVAVPVYVHQLNDTKTAPRFCKPGTPPNQWPVIAEDNLKLFSLYKNSFFQITKKNGDVIRGYFVKFDIAGANISLRVHDNDQSKGVLGLLRSGITTLKNFQVLRVDVLGNLYSSQMEE